MSARFRARRQAVNDVVARASRWAAAQADVRASIVVGSYAYGRPRMGSDVDIIVLSEEVQARLATLDFIAAITPRARLVRAEQWGPMHERRVRLPSGLQVEFGIAAVEWAAVPLDLGTARVIADGCKILVDDGLVADALVSLGRSPVRWQPVT